MLTDVGVSILDGALGLLATSSDAVRALIGVSSNGTVNEVNAFSTKEDVAAALGYGPLVEAAAHSLDIAGGTVICVRVDGNVAAIIGAVTKSNGAAPIVAITGTPVDDFEVVIEIVATGILGAGTFRFSLDGGATWSTTRTITATTGINALGDSGLIATFAAGSYTAEDTFSFDATAAKFDAGALGEAIDALLEDSREWGFIHVVGLPVDGTAAAVLAATLITSLAEAEAAHRYAFGIIETPAELAGGELTPFEAVADKRLCVAAGGLRIASPISRHQLVRSVAFCAAARIAKVAISVDPGRVRDGAIPGVLELIYDERLSPGADDAGFLAMCTRIGRAGFYVNQGTMKAAEDSDYQTVDRIRVINRACKVARDGLMRYLLDNIVVDSATGYIDEIEAVNIENAINSQLEAALITSLPRHASSTRVELPRNVNLLTTSQITARVRVVPLATAREIVAEVGLENPAAASA